MNAAGNYLVSVTGTNGCSATSNAVRIESAQEVPPATLVASGGLSCAVTSVTLTANTGSGLSYRFSSGATQLGSGNTATVNAAGTYSVTVTNTATGCTNTASIVISQDNSQPTVSVSPTTAMLSCGVPTATLTANTAASSLTWSTGQTTPSISVNVAGTYWVTVSSANGCKAVAQATVSGTTDAPTAPTLAAAPATTTAGQPITVTANGCTGGTISWTALGSLGQASGTTYTLTQPGNYTLSATCSLNGCTSSLSAPLVLQIRPGGFAIRGVELVRCQLVDAGRGQYEVSLTPQYSGLSGSPLRFGITNELAVTTAPGPYTIQLYTDNPAITLTASQADQQASYRYSWLAACNNSQPAPNRAPVAQSIPNQVLVVGQPYQLELTNYFTDPDGQVLTFTATGLPAGLQLSGSRITGSPTQAGTVTVALTALDPGGLQAEGSVVLRIDPAPVTPTPGVFSIAGVTGVRCETVTASERRLIFSPVYTGLTGEAISFGITNEVAPTSAPGPYAVRLYTDNPAVTLTATQGGSATSYRYNWLADCATKPNGRQAVVEVVSPLSVVVLGNPVVGESVEVLVRGVEGQSVELSLRDLTGNRLHQQSIPQASGTERVVVPVPAGQAMTILTVSTASQHQTIKLIQQ